MRGSEGSAATARARLPHQARVCADVAQYALAFMHQATVRIHSQPRPRPCPCGRRDRRGQAHGLCPVLRPLHRGFREHARCRRRIADALALYRLRAGASGLPALCHLACVDAAGIAEFEPGVKWLGLDVRSRSVLDADHAEIEFVARQRSSAGAATRLHERSRFVREGDRWFYLEGDLQTASTHRAMARTIVPTPGCTHVAC